MKIRYFIFILFISFSACSLLENGDVSCYRIKDGEVFLRYYGGYPRAKEVFLKVEGADAETFKCIENSRNGACQHCDIYGKDKNSVYYRTEKIRFASTKTFEVLGLGYSRDDNNVFYRNKEVEKVDAPSFFVIENERNLPYGADKYGLIMRDIPVSTSIHCKTFEVLANPYFKDKHHVYFGPKYEILEGADPRSFTCPKFKSIVNYQYYALDKRNAYYYEKGIVKIIPNIDYDSFTILSKLYAKDKSQVFYKFQIIEGADVESFHVPHRVNENVGKDKNYKYVNGEIEMN